MPKNFSQTVSTILVFAGVLAFLAPASVEAGKLGKFARKHGISKQEAKRIRDSARNQPVGAASAADESDLDVSDFDSDDALFDSKPVGYVNPLNLRTSGGSLGSAPGVNLRTSGGSVGSAPGVNLRY